ncbi:HPr family phosphocarrier protein [Borrelia miyamotoi]|nr:HPr family phosphocarrier protein [Borrelia miyamotoi]AJA58600.1 phosphocarrier protein HPr [Borrelia miyamotoi]AOW95679.1 phosphocarrier protein HPr [Borrelia miyamotoi]QTL83564.1 HPr family phosphocarrier protein [Borrelia miyamotoi]WAZ97393.1 HPr family phosphocarrier protein [Borrelia miyamotoi]
MQTMIIKITNKEGIHSKPSSMIADFASQYPFCDIKLVTEDKQEADAKSVVEIMILGVKHKEKIKIIANGKEEIEIINQLSELLLNSSFTKEIKE